MFRTIGASWRRLPVLTREVPPPWRTNRRSSHPDQARAPPAADADLKRREEGAPTWKDAHDALQVVAEKFAFAESAPMIPLTAFQMVKTFARHYPIRRRLEEPAD